MPLELPIATKISLSWFSSYNSLLSFPAVREIYTGQDNIKFIQ